MSPEAVAARIQPVARVEIGRRYADLVSELLWKPMDAKRSAYITVDRLGAPRCAGGLCATVEDLARVGQFLVEGRFAPAASIDDLERNGDPGAWDRGTFAGYFPGLAMHYRSKWYAVRGGAPLFFGFGIHDQHLFVDRRNALVIAKVSSQTQPLDAAKIARTTRAIAEIRSALSRP